MPKKLIFTLTLLVLSACAPSRNEIAQMASQQCPSIGINSLSPDYSVKLSPESVNSYYSCMITQTQPSDATRIGAAGSPARNIFNGKDEASERMQLRLRYQYALWLQVLNKEISGAKAQQEWLTWSTQVDLQEQANKAANQQAIAAMNANQNQSMHCTGMNMGGGMSTINCN